MHRKNIKHFALIFGTSFILSLMMMPFRGGYINLGGLTSASLASIVGFLSYWGISYFLLSRYKNKLSPGYILLMLLTGAFILESPVRIIDFEGSLISFPDFLMRLAGILLAYLIFKLTSFTFKITISTLTICLALWVSLSGYHYWFNYLHFGTFSGKIDIEKEYLLPMQKANSDTLSLTDFKGKHLILDCWYTHCGVCYKEMPKVQEFYDKYKQNPQIATYALHCRLTNESETVTKGTDILDKKGYSYPCLSIDIKDPILKELGVNVYPTVLIFDKDSKLIFRGSIDDASKTIDKLMKNK